MYANPVSGASPATSCARSDAHPLLRAGIQLNVSIATLGRSVSRRSWTKRGHEGTRPSAFSAALRRYDATTSPGLRVRARL